MTKFVKAFLVAGAFGLHLLAGASGVNAQVAIEVTPTSQIPKDYRSWSLFLVCNPAWIVENGDKGLAGLFWQYQAFGASIGPNNLAIWFWKNRSDKITADNTDLNRSSTYCQKFKLLPSESPHVLVTTRHPDEADPGERFFVGLNGLSANDSALVLTKLADQMVVTGLNQSGLDASDKWRRVLAAISAAVNATGCYFNKVSFSLKTGILSTEIGHSTDGANPGC